MILQMITIHDAKAEMYSPPLFFKTIGMAKRQWIDILHDPENEYAKHPADYTLIHLGVYDDSTAEVVLESPPKSLGTGTEFLNINEPMETAHIDQANGKDSNATV